MTLVLLLGAALSPLSTVLPSAAQTVPAVPNGSAESETSLSDTYKAAFNAYKRGDYASAYNGFLQVWRAEKKPKAAGNLGRSELALKKYRDAAEHLAFFLREQKDAPADDRKEVLGLLGEAKAKVVTLRIEVTQVGAEISIDGVKVGAAPMVDELYVEPGRHEVGARLGQLTAQKKVEASAGAAITIKLDLARPIGPVAGDGEDAASGREQPPVPLPASRPFPVQAVVLAGGIGVAGAGGVLLGIGASQKSDAVSDAPKDGAGHLMCSKRGSGFDRGPVDRGLCNEMRARTGTADTVWGVGMGMVIVGGAAAVGAAVSWLLPDAQTTTNKPSSQVVPVVSASGGGLLWQGSF